MIIILFTLVISIPIIIFSIDLSHYGRINESKTFYYQAENSSTIKQLNVNTQIGEIELVYDIYLVDHVAKIDLELDMLGRNLVDKNFSDFFDILWQNVSDIVNFTMKIKTEWDLEQVISFIRNLKITLTLRADVSCDIDLIVPARGDVRLNVPIGISIGNIFANVSQGNINLNFRECIVKGNITAIIHDEGELYLTMYEVEYIHNSTWYFNTGAGDIFIDIVQNVDMKANISGIFTHRQGDIRFIYQDTNSNNSAYFKLHVNPNDYAFSQAIKQISGFIPDSVTGQNIYNLLSEDYPAKYNFNLLLNNTNGLYRMLDLDNY